MKEEKWALEKSNLELSQNTDDKVKSLEKERDDLKWNVEELV